MLQYSLSPATTCVAAGAAMRLFLMLLLFIRIIPKRVMIYFIVGKKM